MLVSEAVSVLQKECTWNRGGEGGIGSFVTALSSCYKEYSIKSDVQLEHQNLKPQNDVGTSKRKKEITSNSSLHIVNLHLALASKSIVRTPHQYLVQPENTNESKR